MTELETGAAFGYFHGFFKTVRLDNKEASNGFLGFCKSCRPFPRFLVLDIHYTAIEAGSGTLACTFERPYGRLAMFIVHVFVQVKPDCMEAFREATIENARHSIEEPGVVRFDVIQQRDDPTQFVLVEVYRTEADTASHKRTPHYAKWQATVEDLLAQPRSRIFYQNIFPDDKNW